MSKFDNIQDVLSYVQKNLVAPKNQYNSFGKYNYRSCEDILQGLKEVMPDGATVTISDEIVSVADRIYVKATACLQYGEHVIQNSAYAREPVSKKGMDDAQVTGATSSYARKYALNGLFMIDDTKDADSRDNSKDEKPKPVSGEELNGLIEEIKASLTIEEFDSARQKARAAYKRMVKPQKDRITDEINKAAERLK